MDLKTTNLNGLVSLPIIISDHDSEKRSLSQNHSPSHRTVEQGRSSSFASDTSESTSQRHWKTGFSDLTDDIWSRLSTTMKQKLRDACVEVLRRTEDGQASQRDLWGFDDDARFLD